MATHPGNEEALFMYVIRVNSSSDCCKNMNKRRLFKDEGPVGVS